MDDHSNPFPMPVTAGKPDRPLLSALARWWSPADCSAVDPVLGYESAQPWRLDDDTAEPAGLPNT